MKEEFKKVYDRYLKYSKVSFRIAIVSLVISFVLVVFNTGNGYVDLVARVGLVIFVTSLFESYFLRLIARIYKNRNKMK